MFSVEIRRTKYFLFIHTLVDCQSVEEIVNNFSIDESILVSKTLLEFPIIIVRTRKQQQRVDDQILEYLQSTHAFCSIPHLFLFVKGEILLATQFSMLVKVFTYHFGRHQAGFLSNVLQAVDELFAYGRVVVNILLRISLKQNPTIDYKTRGSACYVCSEDLGSYCIRMMLQC